MKVLYILKNDFNYDTSFIITDVDQSLWLPLLFHFHMRKMYLCSCDYNWMLVTWGSLLLVQGWCSEWLLTLVKRPLSSRLKLDGCVWSSDQGPRALGPWSDDQTTKHTHPVSTVVIVWHTYSMTFEPKISKSKTNITRFESFITIFSFL